MIEAVLFDMDGLMIDSEIVCYEIYKEYFKQYDITLRKVDYLNCFAGRSIENGLIHARDYYHLSYEIEDVVVEIAKIEKEKTKNGVNIKKGLKELLKYLKDNHYKTAIATSSGLDRVHKLLDSHQILSYFDTIVCGNEIEHGKPAPDIFLKACEKLKVEPHQALVLEDSQTGIEAASRAHIPVICVIDLYAPNEEISKKTLKIYDSLFDVLEYLKMSN